MPGELEEQLAFALGMTIEQRAAPAVRVKQAIARIYGVPLERRMQRLVARLSGEAPSSGSMPPPLGAVPSVMEPPRPPSAPPVGRSTARNFLAARAVSADADVPPPAPDTSPRGLSAPPVAYPPPSEPPDSAPPSTPVLVERRTGLLQREVPQSVRTARRRRGPVTFETAKHEAEEAADRDALLDLFFDFARQFFDYSVMFLVHGDIAEGRDAFGAGASRERVVGIGVPLDLPGLIASVRERRTALITKAPPDGLDAELLVDLQRARDSEIAIVPLVVRVRAVAILVGDCGDHGVDRSSVQQIIAFASVIGKAFERIIVRKKLDGFIAGSQGAGSGRVDPSLVSADMSKKGSRMPSLLPSELHGSAPPPTANIASVRPIVGPPIPREEPPDSSPLARPPSVPPARPEVTAPRARSVPPPPGPASTSVAPLPVVTSDGPAADADARMLFDELGSWDAAVEDIPPPPPSAAIAVAAHRPPLRHTDPPNELPSVIVDMDRELAAIVERLAQGVVDEQAEGELLRQGERAMRALMVHFPGPLTFERSRIAITTPPPRPSECGPILRLVTRERKVALPFELEKLSDPDTETRGWATHVLSELPYPEAIPPLLLRLRDVDLSTRVSAAYALVAVARLYPEEVRAGVLAVAHGADPIDRAAATRVMGELREPSLVPELVRALADGDEAVVASAHASLVLVTRQDFGLDARPWLRWWELSSSRSRIEWLIDALTHEVSEIRRAAGEELRATSKEYFGYASDLPQRDRERAQQRYRDWWVTEGRARFRRKG
jgi:HEAT repeat protein